MNTYTAKDIIETLKQANGELEKTNLSLVNENAALLYELRNGYSALKMRIDALARDVLPLPDMLARLSVVEKNQIKNTESRKKFEAVYWKRIGE